MKEGVGCFMGGIGGGCFMGEIWGGCVREGIEVGTL